MIMLKNIVKWYLNLLYIDMRNARRKAQKILIEKDPKALFLDCGCREGDNTLEIAKSIGTEKILGLDYNWRVLHQAVRRGIWGLQADLNRSIPLKNDCVDVIVASDVLEHLVNPYIFVGEMYRVLRAGGYVVLDTPNLASWHNIFALLIGIQPFSGPNITSMEEADLSLVQEIRTASQSKEKETGFYYNEPELTRHIVVVAYVSLLRLFKQHGFLIEQVQGYGYYPLPPLVARLFQRLDPRHAHHIVLKARKPLLEG
jgi:ubiquinone/menaquinone biosynthesis C-methylase UbiE